MSRRGDEIADKLLACIPSRFLEPHQLSSMERTALAAAAGCEMKVRMIGDAVEATTIYEIAIGKEGDSFLVYERRPGDQGGKLRGRVRGLAPSQTRGDHRLQ